MESSSFTALLREVRGVPVLRISGEIDLHSVPPFRDALEKTVAAAERAEAPVRALVVDLSEAGFVDSMGIGALMGSTQGFRKGSGEVRLVVLGREVLRLLEVTGLHETLRVYPDALSAAEDRRGGTR